MARVCLCFVLKLCPVALGLVVSGKSFEVGVCEEIVESIQKVLTVEKRSHSRTLFRDPSHI